MFCTTKKQRQQERQTSASTRSEQLNERQERHKYVPPAIADILLSRSVTACSRWVCSLFASERAFSAFFALASADLVEFSALALVAVAASKAFLEAVSSASSDEMRALAIAKASTIQTGKGKSNKTAKKGSENKQNIGKEITLGSHSSFQVLDTFSAQGDKLLHQDLSRKST
jgi:hypothetical protein